MGTLAIASVAGVVRTSLRPGLLGEDGFGLGAWRRVTTDEGFLESVGFTVWVAFAASIVALVAAVPIALLLRRGRPMSRAAIALPVAAPHLVIAALATLWLAPGGLVDRLAGGLPVTLTGEQRGLGIVLVYAWKETPFLVLLALAALDRATLELEHSATMVGATPWQRLRDVVLPRLVVPLAGGGMLIGAFVIGAVEVPLLMGPTRPDMLGTYALDVVRLDGPAARADAAVAHVVAAGLVAVIGAILLGATRRRTRSVS